MHKTKELYTILNQIAPLEFPTKTDYYKDVLNNKKMVTKLNQELLDSLSFNELLIYQTAYIQGILDSYHLINSNDDNRDLLSLKDALNIYVLQRSKAESEFKGFTKSTGGISDGKGKRIEIG